MKSVMDDDACWFLLFFMSPVSHAGWPHHSTLLIHALTLLLVRIFISVELFWLLTFLFIYLSPVRVNE